MDISISGLGRRPMRMDALEATRLLYNNELPDTAIVSALGVEWSASEWYRAMHREPPLEEGRVAGTKRNPPVWVDFQKSVGVWLGAEHAGTGAKVLSERSFTVPGTTSEIRPDYIVWNDPDIELVVDAKHKAEGGLLLRVDVLQVWTYTLVLGGAGAVVVPTGTRSAARVFGLRHALGVARHFVARPIDRSIPTTTPRRRS